MRTTSLNIEARALVTGLKLNIGDDEFLFCFLNPNTHDFDILFLWSVYGVGSSNEVKKCMISW